MRAGGGRRPSDNVNDRLRRQARRDRRQNRKSMWLYIGVGVLILLLILWLTIADFWGDTDVAADMITPLF